MVIWTIFRGCVGLCIFWGLFSVVGGEWGEGSIGGVRFWFRLGKFVVCMLIGSEGDPVSQGSWMW